MNNEAENTGRNNNGERQNPPPQKSLVDKYLNKVKNNPVLSLLIVLGLSVIAISQFTGAVKHLLNLLPSWEEQLPDLIIYKVDLENSKVHIVNNGKKSVPTDKLYLAWSEGWYRKPEWNNTVNVGSLMFVNNRLIEAGERLPIRIEMLDKVDKNTEFMIDAGQMIEESDESNNCVNTKSETMPCRRTFNLHSENNVP